MVIDDDGEQGIAGSEKEQADEEMEIDLSNVCLLLSLIVHNCMIVMPFFFIRQGKENDRLMTLKSSL